MIKFLKIGEDYKIKRMIVDTNSRVNRKKRYQMLQARIVGFNRQNKYCYTFNKIKSYYLLLKSEMLLIESKDRTMI